MLKHWAWNYFLTDGLLFRSNNFYKNAWCIRCLNHHKNLLWQFDVVGTATSGTSGDRIEADWEAQGYLQRLYL